MSEWIKREDFVPTLNEFYWCWREGWSGPEVLCWKRNERIARRPPEEWNGKVPEYYGNAYEDDDYESADPDKFPTHVMPFITPKPPK